MALEIVLIAILAVVAYRVYSTQKKPDTPDKAERKSDNRSSRFVKERSHAENASSAKKNPGNKADNFSTGLTGEEAAATEDTRLGNLRIEVRDESMVLVTYQTFVYSQDGGFTNVVANGSAELTLPSGSITVFAQRGSGATAQTSEPVSVEITSGQISLAILQFKPVASGEVHAGIEASRGDEWFEIVRVIKGSVADRQGLREGDLILSINGAQALEINDQAFVSALQGPAGTQIKLELAVQENGEWAEAHVDLTLE
jgi:C-terminal processing protease CtpA/Prc